MIASRGLNSSSSLSFSKSMETASDRSESPVPGTMPLSCSEADSSEDDSLFSTLKAGEISPNNLYMQRSLSPAVVNSIDSKHGKYLQEDRPKILVPPNLKRSNTVPSSYGIFTSHSLRLDAWSEPPAASFNVRGKNYMRDSKKITSESSLFQLLAVDFVSSAAPNFKGLCAHPNERLQKALKLERQTGSKQLPEFIFAVNLCVPASSAGKAQKGSCYHCVFYFGIEDKSLLTNKASPVGRVCNKFFFGDSDKFRDSTFKLIPRIVEGNFVVRKAVGSKPSILGSKLKQHYIRTDRYFELIVDIGSDSVAQRIVKLALGYAKNLTVDMMFLLEGTCEKTLPERILGGVRMISVDFKKKDGQRVCEAMV